MNCLCFEIINRQNLTPKKKVSHWLLVLFVIQFVLYICVSVGRTLSETVVLLQIHFVNSPFTNRQSFHFVWFNLLFGLLQSEEEEKYSTEGTYVSAEEDEDVSVRQRNRAVHSHVI